MDYGCGLTLAIFDWRRRKAALRAAWESAPPLYRDASKAFLRWLPIWSTTSRECSLTVSPVGSMLLVIASNQCMSCSWRGEFCVLSIFASMSRSNILVTSGKPTGTTVSEPTRSRTNDTKSTSQSLSDASPFVRPWRSMAVTTAFSSCPSCNCLRSFRNLSADAPFKFFKPCICVPGSLVSLATYGIGSQSTLVDCGCPRALKPTWNSTIMPKRQPVGGN
mmetsp:Transcript_111715/g.249607  ORF Transcript_111715/g.249607 Transcript_111715/m.249607 type:complete len:220 (-) Transcript_111715:451-1110(-)